MATARAACLRHLARPDTASRVAETDGAVIGCTSLEFRGRLNRDRLRAWIPDRIVTARAGGRGASCAGVAQGIALAHARGRRGVALASGIPDTSAPPPTRSGG